MEAIRVEQVWFAYYKDHVSNVKREYIKAWVSQGQVKFEANLAMTLVKAATCRGNSGLL
jgi:hypothetical protein